MDLYGYFGANLFWIRNKKSFLQFDYSKSYIYQLYDGKLLALKLWTGIIPYFPWINHMDPYLEFGSYDSKKASFLARISLPFYSNESTTRLNPPFSPSTTHNSAHQIPGSFRGLLNS